jgi:AcrR family transcriptional regulator
MARPKGSKKEQLILAARSLFFKYGYRRVTIEEICRTADVSKVTFYKNFRDKAAIIRAVIGRIADEKLAGFISVMDLDLPFAERMRRLVEMRLAQADEVHRDFLREYASLPPEIHEYIQHKTQEALATAMGYYVRAQNEGAIRADVKPAFISWFLNHATDMMADGRLVALYDTSREVAAEVINLFLYGILARKE